MSSKITSERQKVIRSLLSKHGLASDVGRILRAPQSHGDLLPASYAQQRLWFLHQFDPRSSAYNMPMAFRITGNLQAEALCRSINTIVSRHDILRTTFRFSDAKLYQVVDATADVHLPLISLGPIEDIDGAIRRVASEEAVRPFDLDHGPLIRSRLIKIDETDHVLLITVHHIAFDGMSIGILLGELRLLYQAFINSEANPLKELPIQYADYAYWEQTQKLDDDLAYWLQHLAGPLPTLELLKDRQHVPNPTGRAEHIRIYLGEEVIIALRSLARVESTTVFNILRSAFHVVLSRYTRSDVVITGTTTTGRHWSELKDLVGCFVNLLAIKTNCEGKPTFREFVHRVHNVATEAIIHQNVPFDGIVRELRPDREQTRLPIVQVVFENVNVGLQVPGLSHAQINPIWNGANTTAKFDLSVSTWVDNDQIGISFEYASDFFSEATIRRLAEHFRTFIINATKDPDRTVSDLDILTNIERKQILLEWNTTSRWYPKDKCVHELIEAQVDRTPNNRAIRCAGGVLTYAELNRLAIDVAQALIGLNVNRNCFVGICLERSTDLVICQLGVLKSGGAYIPFDPTYPDERTRFTAANSGVKIVLTNRVNAVKFHGSGITILTIEDIRSGDIHPGGISLGTETYSNDYIYGIYTSGSSGIPKLAQIQHASFTNLITWYVKELRISSDDRFLIISAPSFDLTQKNILAPLTMGGEVVFLSGEIYDPHEIVDVIEREQITVINCTPSAAYPLLHACDGHYEKLQSLRYLVLGGEPISVNQLRSWVNSAYCKAEIINTYGPTECTDIATYHKLSASDYTSTCNPPIGRPIDNVCTYILNKDFQPVPIGVDGELFIAGDGVGPGYRNDDVLTSEKFVINPLCSGTSNRVYRTGDYARYLSDGLIEFRGRLDYQVKIRGFRVAPEEIEQELSSHPHVRQCVIITDKTADVDRLVAFVESQDNSDFDPSELRSYLKGRLPLYMVPSFFVELNEIPTTPNGKVDRNALPLELISNFDAEDRVPSNDRERILTQLWSEILGLEKVSVSDNFFDIGGDSLLVISMCAVAKDLGIAVTPRQVYETPRISELVALLNTPVVKADTGDDICMAFLTPIQSRLLEKFPRNPDHYNSATIWKVNKALDPVILETAVDKLLKRHDALRLQFVKGDTDWYQVVREPGCYNSFEYIKFDQVPSHERKTALYDHVQKIQSSMSLTGGVLLRIVYYDFGNEAGRLLFCIHHIATDSFSNSMYRKNLVNMYNSIVNGEERDYTKEPNSFIKWAQQLDRFAENPFLLNDHEYWRSLPWRKLRPIPVDYEENRMKNLRGSFQFVRTPVDPSLSAMALASAKKNWRISARSLLLASYAYAYHKWTSECYVLVDEVSHARREILLEDLDLSDVTGWFVSHYPIVIQIDENTLEHFGTFVKSVDTQIQQIPNYGMTYGILRYKAPDRIIRSEYSQWPQPEVIFKFEGQSNMRSTVSTTSRSKDNHVWLEPAPDSPGPSRSLVDSEDALLRFMPELYGNRIDIVWNTSPNLHNEETISKLTNWVCEALRRFTEVN